MSHADSRRTDVIRHQSIPKNTYITYFRGHQSKCAWRPALRCSLLIALQGHVAADVAGRRDVPQRSHRRERAAVGHAVRPVSGARVHQQKSALCCADESCAGAHAHQRTSHRGVRRYGQRLCSRHQRAACGALVRRPQVQLRASPAWPSLLAPADGKRSLHSSRSHCRRAQYPRHWRSARKGCSWWALPAARITSCAARRARTATASVGTRGWRVSRLARRSSQGSCQRPASADKRRRGRQTDVLLSPVRLLVRRACLRRRADLSDLRHKYRPATFLAAARRRGNARTACCGARSAAHLAGGPACWSHPCSGLQSAVCQCVPCRAHVRTWLTSPRSARHRQLAAHLLDSSAAVDGRQLAMSPA